MSLKYFKQLKIKYFCHIFPNNKIHIFTIIKEEPGPAIFFNAALALLKIGLLRLCSPDEITYIMFDT